MQAIVQQFFNFGIMAKAFPLVLTGLWTTLLICLVVIPLGFSGGVLVAAISLSHNALFRRITRLLVDLFRALAPTGNTAISPTRCGSRTRRPRFIGRRTCRGSRGRVSTRFMSSSAR